MTYNHKAFVAWLEKELYRRDWKPIDLARRINPDTPANAASSISRWRMKKRQPDTRSCVLLAEIFGADTDYVLALAGHRTMKIHDTLIDSITASLQALPRAQVELIAIMVRGLHNEAIRTRTENP